MRLLAVLLALSAMLATPTSAQGPAPVQPGAQAPAPVQPGAQAPAPLGAPAPTPESQTPGPPQEPAASRVPFQDGFKYAYINIQMIAAESKQGQGANTSINALRERLSKEITGRQQKLQETQKQLESQGSILSDTARLELQTELERQQRDIQRLVEDAEEDIGRLTDRLQQEFMVSLNPVIDRIAREKKIDMIFNAVDSGLVWAAPGMDLTVEVIAAFDAGGAGTPAAGR